MKTGKNIHIRIIRAHTNNMKNIIVCVNSVHTSGSLGALLLRTRKVAAAPTTVEAITTEAAASGRAEVIVSALFPRSCDFTSTKEQKLGSSPCSIWQQLNIS